MSANTEPEARIARARIARILTRFETLHPAEIDLGLERITALLCRLGNPHRHLPPVIHVAGTNGKGSVIALLGAMAKAGGLAAHIHTSPHLHHLNERYVLGRSGPMDETALADLLEEVEAVNDGVAATQYELMSAVMFAAFARAPANLALIEVGLGGEYDATNVLPSPALCLIAPIAHDHADYLGTELAGIARAKAGIIKPGTPVICARQQDGARQIIVAKAARAGTKAFFEGEDFQVRGENGRLLYEDGGQMLDLPMPRLRGVHQLKNAGLAVAAAIHMDWSHEAIAQGLELAKWPGRFEVLCRGRLAEMAARMGAQLIVDGAHNPHAARALAASVQAMQGLDVRPLVLVAGLQQSKDVDGFFAAFTKLGAHAICVPPAGAPHPMQRETMQAAALKAGLTATMAPDVHAGLTMALSFTKEPRIVVCGSLYLAASVLAMNAGKP